MDSSKESIKMVFEKFGNGETIDVDQVEKLCQELGNEFSSNDIKKAFHPKAFPDKKVYFEDFWAWYNLKTQNLDTMAKININIRSVLKKGSSHFTQLKKSVSSVQAGLKHNSTFELAIGETIENSKVLAGLAGVENDSPAVIIRVRSTNAGAAKNEAAELVLQALELAQGFIPHPEALKIIESLRSETADQGEFVAVALHTDKKMIEGVTSQYDALINEVLGGNFSFGVRLDVATDLSLKMVLENKNEKEFELVGKAKALSAKLNLHWDDVIVNILRQVAYDRVNTKFANLSDEEKKVNKKFIEMVNASVLTLFNSSNFKLSFKNVANFAQILKETTKGGMLDTVPLIDNSLNDLKAAGLGPMSQQLPLVPDIIELAKKYLEADVEITVQLPVASLVIGVKTVGLREFYDEIVG